LSNQISFLAKVKDILRKVGNLKAHLKQLPKTANCSQFLWVGFRVGCWKELDRARRRWKELDEVEGAGRSWMDWDFMRSHPKEQALSVNPLNTWLFLNQNKGGCKQVISPGLLIYEGFPP